MLKIQVVKTNHHVFVKPGTHTFKSYIVNGEKPKDSFKDGWFVINGDIETIQTYVKQSPVNKRFELVKDAPGKDELPKVMPYNEVMHENEDGYCEWKDEFKHLQSLYEYKQDEREPTLKDVEFEITNISTVDGTVGGCSGFQYDVYATKWKHDGTIKLTEKNIKHQLIDEIVFPDILLCERPSKLTSKQSYNVIRMHVTNNIDSKYAKITSDYDFCFTVKKVVQLNSVQEYIVEKLTPRLNSYRPKRYETKYRNTRDVVIFEMTHSESNYKGYTPIPGFVGNSHDDLKNKIDKYLNDLMDEINAPLKECSCCDGRGVVWD